MHRAATSFRFRRPDGTFRRCKPGDVITAREAGAEAERWLQRGWIAEDELQAPAMAISNPEASEAATEPDFAVVEFEPDEY